MVYLYTCTCLSIIAILVVLLKKRNRLYALKTELRNIKKQEQSFNKIKSILRKKITKNNLSLVQDMPLSLQNKINKHVSYLKNALNSSEQAQQMLIGRKKQLRNSIKVYNLISQYNPEYKPSSFYYHSAIIAQLLFNKLVQEGDSELIDYFLQQLKQTLDKEHQADLINMHSPTPTNSLSYQDARVAIDKSNIDFRIDACQ